MRTIKLIAPYLVIILTHILTAGTETMPFNSIPRDKFTNMKIVNVLDYGSIQDAIDAAPEGSTVYFPIGNYIVTEPITITKQINLLGEGFGSKLYQSADEHLLCIGGSSFVRYIRVEDLYLSSAATTPGKSALRLEQVTDSYFKNIVLRGGYYGLHLYGALRNTFVHLETDTGSATLGTPSKMEYCVYVESRESLGSNSNSFLSCGIRGKPWTAERGYHFYSTTGGGRFNIEGGTVEGFAAHGIYVQGIGSSFTIQGVHCEAGGSHIEIYRSTSGIINSLYHSPDASYPLKIRSSDNITISNGFIKGINIDKYSRNTVLENIHLGSGEFTDNGSNTTIRNTTHITGTFGIVRGLQNTSARNLVDGNLEIWSDGVPIGFSRDNNAELVQETGIYRFGTKCCKITVAAGETRGGIYYTISGDKLNELARPDLTNCRNSDYQWTVSGNGTNEYYLEASGGGDPGVEFKPHAVLINGIPTDEGTSGSLADLEWDYADNDSLGYNTLYVRNDGGDPDSESTGYVQGAHKLRCLAVSAWVYVPETDGGIPNLYIYKTGGVGSSYARKSFPTPTEQWTRILNVITLDPSRTEYRIEFGIYDGSEGDTVYFDGIEIVPGMGATSLFDDSRGLDSDLRIGGRFITSPIQTFSDGDATPSVANGSIFKTANTSATTITMLDHGYPGQQITVIISDANTTIDFTGTNLKGNGGADWSPTLNDHMTCVFDGTDWYCNISDNT